MSSYNLVKAIKPKEALGNPKLFLVKLPENTPDGHAIVLGYIYGKATATHQVTRAKPSGEVETWEGLKGDFGAVPAVEGSKESRAPVCFLPTHIHDAIKTVLMPPEGGERPAVVEFAFEVGIRTSAKSSAGFVWTYDMKADIQATAHDPLADMRAKALGLPAPAASAALEGPASGDADRQDAGEEDDAEPPAEGDTKAPADPEPAKGGKRR